MVRTAFLAIGTFLAASGVMAPVDDLTPELALAFQSKALAIMKNGSAQKAASLTTPFEELELNSYLKFGITELLPVGLTEPSAQLQGEGRATLKGTVDLDVVAKTQAKKSWYDPTAYLTGKLPVLVTGVLTTADGVGRFNVERVEVKSLPVPKRLLQEILSHYTKSADNPNGVNLDDQFSLPAQIRQVVIDVGRATVTQ